MFLRFLSFIFLLAQVSLVSAQTTYTITTNELTMCGQEKVFNVIVQNTGGSSIAEENFELNFSYTAANTQITTSEGLFIKGISSVSTKVTYPDFISNSTIARVKISNMAVGEVINISFAISAGCGVNIKEQNQISANAYIKKDGIIVPGTSTSFLIKKSDNGSLVPKFTSDPSWEQTGGLGSLLTRTFVYRNSQPLAFKGAVRFNDELPASVEVKRISVTLPGSTTPIIFEDQNSALLENLTISQNQEIMFEETVRIKECLSLSQIQSTVMISRGCYSYDLCNEGEPFTIKINRDNSKPVISFPNPLPSFDSYFKCYGESEYTDREFSFTNTGAFANDVNIVYLPANGYVTDNSSFRITISGGSRGTITGNFYRNPENIPSEINGSFYGPLFNNNEATSLNAYKDVIAPLDPAYFSNVTVCAPVDFLYSRVINQYIDNADNEIKEIYLENGETIKIEWKDKSCCFNPEKMHSDMRSYYPIFRFFAKDCSGSDELLSSLFTYSWNEFSQKVMPFNPLMSGNLDKCLATRDGEIQEFTIKNTNFVIDKEMTNDPATWGSLVVELKIGDKADLDLSLDGTALVPEYDHQTCANCAIQPCPVTVMPDNTYRIAFNHPTFGNVNPISVTQGPTVNGTKMYWAKFDLHDLYETFAPNETTSKLDVLIAKIKETSIKYSLRAYCETCCEGVNYTRTEISEKLFYLPPAPCTSSCMMPLAKVDYHITVTCPGCITPGGNIVSASFERHPDYLGYVDNGIEDNVPDSETFVSGALRSNCANGDLMISNLGIILSDGDFTRNENNEQGFLLEHLPVNNHLDNLYVYYEIDKNLVSFEGPSFEATLGNNSPIVISNRPPAETSQGYVFHIKASDFGVNDFHAIPNRTIHIKANFRISQGVTGIPKDYFISYVPNFSDCDDCISSGDLIFPGGNVLGRVGCEWEAVPGVTFNQACPVWTSDMAYLCQSGESMFSIYPLEDNTVIVGGGDICNVKLHINHTSGNLNNVNFPNEYRRWRFLDLNPNAEVEYEVQIPEGYFISRLNIANYYVLGNLRSNVYFLEGSEIPLRGAGEDPITRIRIDENNVFHLKLRYKYRDFNEVITPVEKKYKGDKLTIVDDFFQNYIELIFTPDNCSEVPYGTYFGSSRNSLANGPVTYVSIPKIILPDLPAKNAGAYEVDNNFYLSKPFAEIKETSVSANNIYPQNGKFYIPINLNNVLPLNEAGNPNKDFQGSQINASYATFPFLYFQNLDELMRKGFSIKGVYEGVVSASTDLTNKENFYSDNFAHLKADGQTYIAPITNKVYTVVMNYSCVDCDPMLPTACDIGTISYPECITEVKKLELKYGWNCTKYPSSQEDLEEVCNIKNMIPSELKTPAVGLFHSASFDPNAQHCSEFDYSITLGSCDLGDIASLNMDLKLPVGITYISNDLGLPSVINGSNISFNNILTSLNKQQFNSNSGNIIIKVRLKSAPSNYRVNEIERTITGTTYCGTLFNRQGKDEIPLAVVLPGLEDKYCLNQSSVVIIPAISGGSFTLPQSGFTLNSNGSVTFNPASAGIGTHVISYTLPNSNCIASYNVNVVDRCIIGRITSEPITSCAGIPLQFTSTSSGAMDPTTYTWIFTNYSTSPATVVTATGQNPSVVFYVAGVYNAVLKIKDVLDVSLTTPVYEGLVTITNDILVDVVTTDPDAASIICESLPQVSLKANVSSSNPIISYQWYKYDKNRQNRELIPNETSNTINANGPGWYEAVVTDNLGCKNSDDASVINSLEMHCDGLICPGETPKLSLSNMNGVVGVYGIQWKKVGSNEPLEGFVSEEADYECFVVTEACTLQTQQNCQVRFDVVPQPYTLRPAGPLFILPGDSYQISIINPGANNPADVNVSWSTGQTDFSDITVTQPGGYSFSATHKTSGCQTSSSVNVMMPGIHLKTSGLECNGGGTLWIESNGFTIENAASIQWFRIDPISGARTEITEENRFSDNKTKVEISEGGYYEAVYTSITGFTLSRMVYVSAYAGPDEAIEKLDLKDSRFENVSNCSDLTFASDYGCLENSFLDVYPQNYSQLYGKYMINNSPHTPEEWNRGYWTGSALEGHGFLLVDGNDNGGSKVWSKTVPITPDKQYLFKASVQNIDKGTFYVKSELPQLYLLVRYKKSETEKITLRHDIKTIYQMNKPTWLDLYIAADINDAFKDIGTSINPTEYDELEVSLMMSRGGLIGRDIGVDDIHLIEYNRCTTKEKLSIASSRQIRSLLKLSVPSKFTCYGIPVTLVAEDLLQTPGIIYKWKRSDGTVVDDGDGNPFTLTVNPKTSTSYYFEATDPVTQSVTKQYASVSVINPYVNILSAEEDPCPSNARSFIVNKFSGVTALSYKWYVNGILQSGNTGSYSNPALQNGDQIKCELVSACLNTDDSPKLVYSNIVTIGPGAIDAGEDMVVCEGNAINLSATGGVTYTWTPSTGLSDASIANPIATPTQTTTYTVTAVNASGCELSDEITVTVNPKPTPPNLALYEDEVCEGDTISVNVNHYGLPVTIVSRPPFDVFFGTGFQGGFVEVGTVSESGDFIYRTTSPEGCHADAVKHLTVHPKPDPATIAVSPSGDICSGTPFTVSVNYGATNTLVSETYPPFTNRMGGGGPGGFGFSGVMGNQSGDIVIVSKTAEGCSTTTTRAINVKQSPANPTITADLQTVCANSSNVITVDGLSSGGSFALQTPSGASILTFSNPTSSSKQFSIQYGTTGGNVTAIVTGSNGCEVSSSVYINVPVIPVINYTLATEQCYGTPVMLDGRQSSGTSAYFIEIFKVECPTCTEVISGTYFANWFTGEIGLLNLSNIYSGIGFQSGGIYRIKLVPNYACAWMESVTVVRIRPTAVPSFTLPTTVCSNQPVAFDGSATAGELDHFIEIFQTSCSGCTDVTGPYFSSWFNGQAGTRDLKSIFSFNSGNWYKVKLAVNNQGCPWNETSRWVQILGACREEKEIDMDLNGDLYNVYPSPTDGNFWVAKSNLDPAVIQVTDINGRLLKEVRTSEMKTNIDVHHLASGIYVITIIQNDLVVKKKLELRK